MSQQEEDEIVERLLEGTDGDHGIERFDSASISAYKSLATSRGVPLESVIRAACRNELRSVVARPAKRDQS